MPKSTLSFNLLRKLLCKRSGKYEAYVFVLTGKPLGKNVVTELVTEQFRELFFGEFCS